MIKTDIIEIVENMDAACCSRDEIERVRALHEAGLDSEIVKCLRKCRCDLINELHDAQRRVDRLDHLIRSTESK